MTKTEYNTLHVRMKRKYGPAKDHLCIGCFGQAQDWANVSGDYLEYWDDYMPMCQGCHQDLDLTNLQKKCIVSDTRLPNYVPSQPMKEIGMGTGYTFSDPEELALLIATDEEVKRTFAQVVNFPVGKNNYLSWGSTRPGLVHRFASSIGRGKVYGPYAKNLFKWQTTNKKDTLGVLVDLFLYFDDSRKDKALAVAERMIGTEKLLRLFRGIT